ncbi:MAG: GWxTD domain-containing protein [Candidatus Polarisedimenticolia bacterium]
MLRSITATILMAFCATTASAAVRPSGEKEISTSRWREGPVRYIITAEEDREFSELREDEARRRFIDRFWARRDTEPDTLVNEFRRRFWERVTDANTLFSESSKPGWKTDMGRYYILLGPPDDRDTSQELGSMAGRINLRGSIIWRYSHAPNASVGTGLQIVFVRDASGEWRSTTDEAEIEQALSSTMPTGPIPDLAALGFPIPGVPAQMARRQFELDLGLLQEVPTEEELLTALVTAEDFYGAIPVMARYDFFAAARGSTLTALTLSIHPDPLDPERRRIPPSYLIVGRVDPAEEERPAGTWPHFLREIDFSPSAHNTHPGWNGPYLYQAVDELPPGRYKASFAVFDHASRKTGSFSDVVEVPSLSRAELSLSSLCLSETIEPASPEPGKPAPYVIGNLRVTPRLIPMYRNGETFAVYYHVYSALTDPVTSSPRLSIEYQFFVNQGGSYLQIGRPILFESVANSAQGWSFPLRDWPAADFLLRVKVTDTLSGQSASRDVTFKVL